MTTLAVLTLVSMATLLGLAPAKVLGSPLAEQADPPTVPAHYSPTTKPAHYLPPGDILAPTTEPGQYLQPRFGLAPRDVAMEGEPDGCECFF